MDFEYTIPPEMLHSCGEAVKNYRLCMFSMFFYDIPSATEKTQRVSKGNMSTEAPPHVQNLQPRTTSPAG